MYFYTAGNSEGKLELLSLKLQIEMIAYKACAAYQYYFLVNGTADVTYPIHFRFKDDSRNIKECFRDN